MQLGLEMFKRGRIKLLPKRIGKHADVMQLFSKADEDEKL